MRFTSVTAGVALVSGAVAQGVQPADVVTGNPTGVTYVATLPATPFFKAGSLDGNVKGSISAKAGPGGQGVQYDVTFSNIPKEGGPFLYHIHVEPCEPSGGNCTATLAHLDPFQRGEDPVCDPSKPATCQVGDNSGKYGKVTSDPFVASYVDPYSSITADVGGSFIGNRSFVFHFANKTRITCADFHLQQGGSTGGNGTNPPIYPTGSMTAMPTSVPPTSPPVAGANNVVATLGGIVAFLPALAYALL